MTNVIYRIGIVGIKDNGSFDLGHWENVKYFPTGIEGCLRALSESKDGQAVVVLREEEWAVHAVDFFTASQTGVFPNGVKIPNAIREIIEKSVDRAAGGYSRARGHRTSPGVANGLRRAMKVAKALATATI